MGGCWHVGAENEPVIGQGNNRRNQKGDNRGQVNERGKAGQKQRNNQIAAHRANEEPGVIHGAAALSVLATGKQ